MSILLRERYKIKMLYITIKLTMHKAELTMAGCLPVLLAALAVVACGATNQFSCLPYEDPSLSMLGDQGISFIQEVRLQGCSRFFRDQPSVFLPCRPIAAAVRELLIDPAPFLPPPSLTVHCSAIGNYRSGKTTS